MANDEHLDKKDTREILDLKAREISLVDRPAILRTFLVVKRQQEDNMGAFDSTDGRGADDVVEKMEWRDYEDVEKALPADLRSAITSSLAFMKKAGKAEGAPADELGRVAAFLSKVASGKFPYPGKEESDAEKAKKKPGDADSTCAKCGTVMKDGTCPKCGGTAMAKAKAPKKEEDMTEEELAAAEEEKKKAKGKGVAKSEDGFALTISPEGEIEISGQPIAKGRKAFTDERTKAFGDMVKSMMSILADVDPVVAKAIISELAKGALPGDVKWTSGTTPVAASVTKELSDLVKAALEPVAKSVAEIGSKVEEITKARPAPKSGEGDTTDVTKGNNKNFWGGLPLR